ncbi:hypothetical protein FRC05_009263 [Tulasnella sp. 425]|nr:hypothetical protein FRC05_009263 [Tulasnella sp. 425]
MLTNGLRILSDALGWSYFVIWSISFYPQAILNYKRKSVEGYSIDFATLNAISFGCYTFYTSNFLFNDRVREEYRQRHHGKDNSVAPNDLAFCIHAFVLCCITLSQTWLYPRAPGQELSAWHRFVVSAFFTIIIIEGLSVISDIIPTIDFLYHLSYFKLYGSTAKYASQASNAPPLPYHSNDLQSSSLHRRISITSADPPRDGASLMSSSISQAPYSHSLLIAQIDNNWSSITGNPAKLGLSILSIAFPSFFMLQHFVLYNEHSDIETGPPVKYDETSKLLEA